MTATKQRFPLAEAEHCANTLVRMLEPYCERLVIAGSIRRRKPDVGDIEIVAIPKTEVTRTDLFGTPTDERNLFDDRCAGLKYQGTLRDRLDVNGRPAWGKKYKRAVFVDIPVDLFSATSENWGLILALRTGPAEFNLKLVQSKSFGGFLPFSYRVHEGYLWRGDERLATPEEIDVFTALGMESIEPSDRR